VTGNYAVAPDGSQSATRLILNKGAGTTGADESTMRCSLNTTVGSTYTLSVWLKSTDGVSQPKVSLSFNGGEGSATITVTGEWRRYQITTLSAIDANRTPRLQLRGGFGTSDTADILVWGWQQESLPFASSYIPTNGAAVTRASDVAKLPQARNIPDLLGSSYSIAARFTLKPGVSQAFRFLFRTGNVLNESMGIVQKGSAAKLTAYQGSADLSNNLAGLPFVEGPSFVCGLGIRSGKVVGYSSVDRKVVANASTFTPTSNQANFLLGDLWLMSNYQGFNEAWGHIRDLRIWWQELSDAQWKVVS